MTNKKKGKKQLIKWYYNEEDGRVCGVIRPNLSPEEEIEAESELKDGIHCFIKRKEELENEENKKGE